MEVDRSPLSFWGQGKGQKTICDRASELTFSYQAVSFLYSAICQYSVSIKEIQTDTEHSLDQIYFTHKVLLKKSFLLLGCRSSPRARLRLSWTADRLQAAGCRIHEATQGFHSVAWQSDGGDLMHRGTQAGRTQSRDTINTTDGTSDCNSLLWRRA